MHKKGHITNIYLTHSDEEAIVDFVKDHEELYHKTNGHFMEKAWKDCLWERCVSSHNLSVKVCRTWFESQCDQTPHKPWCSFPMVDQQFMDQFAQMKTMLSSFLGLRQESTRIAFCNYLTSEVEVLEERDFQTFRN